MDSHNVSSTAETPLRRGGSRTRATVTTETTTTTAYPSYQDSHPNVTQQQQQPQRHRRTDHHLRRNVYPPSTSAAGSAVDPLSSHETTANSNNNNNNNNNNITNNNNNINNNSNNNNNAAFRGFSTPIVSLFQDDRYEGIDSCSWICCGVLQSDYNRYVVHGITPPSWHRRCHLHVMIPILVFGIAVYCAVHVQDTYVNQLVTTTLVLMLLFYWIIQCCKGRAKRVAVRKELLTLKYYHNLHQRAIQRQEQGDLEEDEEEEEEEDERDERVYPKMGQSYWDLQCAHSLLGCYATDIVRYGEDKKNVDLVEATRHERDNLCSCLWRNLYGVLGCAYTGCSLQCCGICATAQEGRDLLYDHYYQYPLHSNNLNYYHQDNNNNNNRPNALLTQSASTKQCFIPLHVTFVDYITFQPMLDYYPRIYRLRHESNHSSCLVIHLFRSLSKLSKWILSWAALFFTILLLWSLLPMILPQHHSFHWQNYLVLLATFAHGFILLYMVHALWHLLDISIDAVIKYYMSGFVLASTMAILGEICLSLAIRLLTSIIMAMSGIDIVPDRGFGYYHGGNNYYNRTRSHQYYYHSATANNRNRQRRSRHSSYRLSSSWMTTMFTNFLFQSFSSTSTTTQQQSKQPTHHEYLLSFGYAHPIFYTMYVALNSFVVAALVEEICKYLSYRMVTHPDWATYAQLQQIQQDEIHMHEEMARQQHLQQEYHKQQLLHRKNHHNNRTSDDDDDDYDRRAFRDHTAYEEDDDEVERGGRDADDEDDATRSSAGSVRKSLSYSNKAKKKKQQQGGDDDDDDHNSQGQQQQLPPPGNRDSRSALAWKHSSHYNTSGTAHHGPDHHGPASLAVPATADARDVMDFSQQDRTCTSRGAAITVAMVAVAVGFACCENLVYVFLYSGSTVAGGSATLQWAVLLARALFPIHVISAALQSIGVVQRDIEQQQQGTDGSSSGGQQDEKRIRLGRILWPAILFHGSYDFFIIWIEFLFNRRRTLIDQNNNQGVGGGSDGDNGSYGATTVDGASSSNAEAILSLSISVILEVGAVLYFVWKSRAQRKRLEALDGVTTSTQRNATTATAAAEPESSVDPSTLL